HAFKFLRYHGNRLQGGYIPLRSLHDTRHDFERAPERLGNLLIFGLVNIGKGEKHHREGQEQSDHITVGGHPEGRSLGLLLVLLLPSRHLSTLLAPSLPASVAC